MIRVLLYFHLFLFAITNIQNSDDERKNSTPIELQLIENMNHILELDRIELEKMKLGDFETSYYYTDNDYMKNLLISDVQENQSGILSNNISEPNNNDLNITTQIIPLNTKNNQEANIRSKIMKDDPLLEEINNLLILKKKINDETISKNNMLNHNEIKNTDVLPDSSAIRHQYLSISENSPTSTDTEPGLKKINNVLTNSKREENKKMFSENCPENYKTLNEKVEIKEQKNIKKSNCSDKVEDLSNEPEKSNKQIVDKRKKMINGEIKSNNEDNLNEKEILPDKTNNITSDKNEIIKNKEDIIVPHKINNIKADKANILGSDKKDNLLDLSSDNLKSRKTKHKTKKHSKVKSLKKKPTNKKVVGKRHIKIKKDKPTSNLIKDPSNEKHQFNQSNFYESDSLSTLKNENQLNDSSTEPRNRTIKPERSEKRNKLKHPVKIKDKYAGDDPISDSKVVELD